MPIGRFLNVEEAAARIGCTTGRVRQLLRDGTLNGIKANARAWLVDERCVHRVATQQYTTGRPRIAASQR
jgi:hypothetical protein